MHKLEDNNFVLIDIMELKRMMEKMGQAKTHLELKKMIAEVDTTKKGTNYNKLLQTLLPLRYNKLS